MANHTAIPKSLAVYNDLYDPEPSGTTGLDWTGLDWTGQSCRDCSRLQYLSDGHYFERHWHSHEPKHEGAKSLELSSAEYSHL